VSHALYMDAEITPHRSLPRIGFVVLLSLVAAANGIAGTVFFMMGAWPAPVFLGLDVLALWIAFRASYRTGLRAERVKVSSAEVTVLRSEREVWRSPTHFTQVALERAGEHDSRVTLSLSGKRLSIARVLSPAERADFAAALERAIAEARAGRAG
jgi:uncharacterized membrane protein